MAINPRKFTATKLVEKVDDLSLSELVDLKEAEQDGRARKTVLAAVDSAIEAHQELAERLDEIVEESSPQPVAMSVGVYQDRLGWFAEHPALPGFEQKRFGAHAACRAALAARLAG